MTNNADTSLQVGDGHKTVVAKAALLERQSFAIELRRLGNVAIKTWDAKIAAEPPAVQYGDVTSAGVGELLHKIRTFGFCFIDDIEPTPEATQGLLESIGPIRNTHYGGFYDFTSDLSSKDTAYTSESLEPHTDNTYFTEPAGLQALHLLSHTDGGGGESSLVDGFQVAAKLHEQDVRAYSRLSSIPVYAHASGNDGISIQPAEPQPVLSHSRHVRHLTQVRWNNADRAGISAQYGNVEGWYDAAAKFDALISEPKNQYWFQLKPGRLLILDNWRVLHGRAAFTGKRRMAGGYIPRDDFISKFKATNMTAEEIKSSTVTG
ncbi:uncharacterized protein LTR77_005483 [Saxophila tyrrhenica]|uniref:TauD/TfdA-like domain-containing protein n=1 Tax=Saxophila tyrrhenica TaxID=1690608 RepID=A0AAV9PBQ0_9PEZI|nr:hypothetical protein LTR77_005483 [Saxophila tyrrhenica]